MREEIEALGRLVDVASEIEVGLADLARRTDGETREQAERLTELSDGLADSLTAIYIGLAKVEAANASRAEAVTVDGGEEQ